MTLELIDIAERPSDRIDYRIPGQRKPGWRQLPIFEGTVRGLPDTIGSLVITSDLQGRGTAVRGPHETHEAPLLGHLLAAHLESWAESGRLREPYVVIHAGDLWSDPEQRRMGGIGDVTEVWLAFARRAAWVVGVLGNHDLVDAHALHLAGATLLDGRTVERMGLRVGGVSGIIGPVHKPNRRDPAQFARTLTSVLRQPLDVAVTHQGPRLFEGHDKGDDVVNDVYADAMGVGIAVCGHCQWPEVAVREGRTMFLNVDARCIVLTESRERESMCTSPG